MAFVSLPSVVAPLVLSLALFLIYSIAFRLVFHPLAKVPGPKLAALTHLYEAYHDAVRPGQFVFKLDELHEKYGPIARINPREVHIRDTEFYPKLYNMSLKADKDWYYYRFVGTSDASFGTSSSRLHRMRRGAYSKFFAPSAILELEQPVLKRIEYLCTRLEEHQKSQRPVMLGSAFRCLTTDVISQYVLPQGFNLLDNSDFGEDYNQNNRNISALAVWHRHFPFIIPLAMAAPRWIVKRIATPGGLQMFDYQTHLKTAADDAVHSEKRKNTVLHGIVDSDIPESEKTPNRLYQEAITLVGAGAETTGSTLEHIFYGVLANPAILRRLKSELSDTAAKGDLTFDQLKDLPYLSAVIKEGLRLGGNPSGRFPRIYPANPITYKDHTFAPGTVISMSTRDLSYDATLYPDPLKFDPARWMDNGPVAQRRMDETFNPFGRGARSCAGRDLAQLEMVLTTAHLVHRFDLELFETSWAEIEMCYDYFSPFVRGDSHGLQVLVR